MKYVGVGGVSKAMKVVLVGCINLKLLDGVDAGDYVGWNMVAGWHFGWLVAASAPTGWDLWRNWCGTQQSKESGKQSAMIRKGKHSGIW